MTTRASESSAQAAVSCDPVDGFCRLDNIGMKQTVSITYVTDPVCSACWAMEPAWRTLRFRYGDRLDVRHIYGGLLPGWAGFADPGAGIRQPGDVAHHWEEVALHTGQAIDPSVWLTDPIESSYAPSIAAVAARLTDPSREEAFLRNLREQLFLDGRNIGRPETWWAAAARAALSVDTMRARLGDGTAEKGFAADLAAARASGARGFPTVIVELDDNRMTLHGTQSYSRLEQALLTVGDLEPSDSSVTVDDAVALLGTGTSAEYAHLLGVDVARVGSLLSQTGLRPTSLPGGEVWRVDDV